MPRPLPITPKGPRRRPTRRPTSLLACPRTSPAYELNAIHALIKPNDRTKGKIEHVTGHQPWTPHHDATLAATCHDIAERLSFTPEIHRPNDGDYWFAIPFPTSQLDQAKALALVLSRRLPDLYLTLGRLLVHDGRFLRRRYGWQLRLVPATNIHLPRDLRAALKGLV